MAIHGAYLTKGYYKGYKGFERKRELYMEKKIVINEETLKDIISEIFGRMENGSWLSKKVFAAYPKFMEDCATMGQSLRDWRAKIDTSSWNEDLRERIEKEFNDAIYYVETLGLEEYEPGEKPTENGNLNEEVKLTDSKLKKIVSESLRRVINERLQHSEIDYYIEHIIMDIIHDEGQKISSTINRMLIPELKEEIGKGVLNQENVDMGKLNVLIEKLENYADAIDKTYTDIYTLAREVIESVK